MLPTSGTPSRAQEGRSIKAVARRAVDVQPPVITGGQGVGAVLFGDRQMAWAVVGADCGLDLRQGGLRAERHHRRVQLSEKPPGEDVESWTAQTEQRAGITVLVDLYRRAAELGIWEDLSRREHLARYRRSDRRRRQRSKADRAR